MLRQLLAVVVLLTSFTSLRAQNAPYVGSYEALNRFSEITAEQMTVLRTKKILFASRSFGLNLNGGLSLLRSQNSMYDLLNSYVRYDVFGAGSDLSVVPATAFDNYNFVHFLATYWPHTQRIDEMETLLDDAPWNFSADADVVIIFYHTALASLFPYYSAHMDSMQVQYPSIKFIYVCAAYMDSAMEYSSNVESYNFNLQVRAKYKNQVPLYDLGAILNRDGECGLSYCDDYSDDPAGVHPNSDAGEKAMAQGFLLILKDIFFGSTVCTSKVAPSVPTNLTGTPLSTSSVRLNWTASTHPPCGVKLYRVRRNGGQVGISYNNTYTDAGLAEGGSYTYTVAAVSVADSASAWSSPAMVTTLSDTTRPCITLVADTRDSVHVVIEFSENLEAASAQTATNYTLNNGIGVQGAVLAGKTVTLTTTAMANGTTYLLTVNNVRDNANGHNTIAVNSQATFKYARIAYTDDAIGYWPFEGNLNDLSGHNLNGTWTGTAAYGAGQAGQGLALDGTSGGGYPTVADNVILDGMGRLTLSLWAKKTAAATGGSLLKKHVTYDLNISAASVGGYIFSNGAVRTNITATVAGISNTDWHHYCISFDSTAMRVYVDGRLYNTIAAAGPIDATANELYIGKDPWGNSFAGAVDELKIFNRALDSLEVVALYQGGLGGNADSLAVRALLDANSVSRAVDGVAVYDSARRITSLYIQEAGVSMLTSHIGQLTELKVLHCYGDRGLGYPLLTSVSPAIGLCTKLQTLLLNQNNLTTLPVDITAIKSLTNLSLGDNQLCALADTIKNWATVYDPDWAATQTCTQVKPDHLSVIPAPFFVTRNGEQVTITRGALRGALDADIYVMRGKLVYSIQACPDNEMVWRTDEVKSGIYFVRVTNGTMSYVRKLVIVR
jgi:hypothetical protein